MYRGNDTRSTFHDEDGNEVVRDDDAEEMMWRSMANMRDASPHAAKG